MTIKHLMVRRLDGRLSFHKCSPGGVHASEQCGKAIWQLLAPSTGNPAVFTAAIQTPPPFCA